jgi:hypothetical protein
MQKCSAPGTAAFGTFTAITGRDTFGNRMAAGTDCHYMAMAVDANGVPTGNWEAGEGTWNGSALARNIIYKSSNADALVNFTDANVYVFGALLPDETLWLQDDHSFHQPVLSVANPTAPPAGIVAHFVRSNAGRLMPGFMGPSGLDTLLQPHIGRNRAAWWQPIGNATTVPIATGMAAGTAVGTATQRAVAVTNILTRMKRLGYVSAATAASLSGIYFTVAQYTVGDGAGLGGFHALFRFATSDAAAVAGARAFVGMSSSIAAPTNVDPATLTNSVGIAQLSTDNTQWYIVYGGSAAQTAIALGTALGAPTLTNTAFELALFASPGSSNTVGYTVTNLGSGTSVTGSLTGVAGTVLPSSTTLLAPRAWRCNNATAAAVGLDLCGLYIETDE